MAAKVRAHKSTASPRPTSWDLLVNGNPVDDCPFANSLTGSCNVAHVPCAGWMRRQLLIPNECPLLAGPVTVERVTSQFRG